MKAFLLVLSLFILNKAYANGNRIKKIELKSDQIAEVKTALGIATIIQVPNIPSSVVVGDSEAFKVEYLDQAITIKPLHAGAKSNLYIYTDYRRYNVQLTSVPTAQANYIVYLSSSQNKDKKFNNLVQIVKSLPRKIRWWKIERSLLKNDGLVLLINRVGLSSNNVILVDFILHSKKLTQVNPSIFSLRQNGKSITIHNLFLSGLKADNSRPVTGMFEVIKDELDTTRPFRLEIQRQKTTFLTVKEIDQWEKLKISR